MRYTDKIAGALQVGGVLCALALTFNALAQSNTTTPNFELTLCESTEQSGSRGIWDSQNSLCIFRAADSSNVSAACPVGWSPSRDNDRYFLTRSPGSIIAPDGACDTILMNNHTREFLDLSACASNNTVQAPSLSEIGCNNDALRPLGCADGQVRLIFGSGTSMCVEIRDPMLAIPTCGDGKVAKWVSNNSTTGNSHGWICVEHEVPDHTHDDFAVSPGAACATNEASRWDGDSWECIAVGDSQTTMQSACSDAGGTYNTAHDLCVFSGNVCPAGWQAASDGQHKFIAYSAKRCTDTRRYGDQFSPSSCSIPARNTPAFAANTCTYRRCTTRSGSPSGYGAAACIGSAPVTCAAPITKIGCRHFN